jgi:hypothetical protein
VGCGAVFTAVPRPANSLRASFRRASGELSRSFRGRAWSLSTTIKGSALAFEAASASASRVCTCFRCSTSLEISFSFFSIPATAACSLATSATSSSWHAEDAEGEDQLAQRLQRLQRVRRVRRVLQYNGAEGTCLCEVPRCAEVVSGFQPAPQRPGRSPAWSQGPSRARRPARAAPRAPPC